MESSRREEGSEDLTIRSFEGFYRSSWSEIHHAVAVVVGGSDLAGEAVDEAMVRAFERWGEVSGYNNPEGWVYRVAVNWAQSWLRRLRFRSNSEIPDLAVDDPNVADPRILTAIQRLSLAHREVVVARLLLDLSEADTAEALGVPRGTVKSGLHRALNSLKEDLE